MADSCADVSAETLPDVLAGAKAAALAAGEHCAREAATPATAPAPAGAAERGAAPLETTWWGSATSFRLAALLEETHGRVAADKDFVQTCEECLKVLKEACSAALSKDEFRVQPFDWTPDVQLEAFGSTRQGTALLSSDLDVRMSFQQFDVHDSQRQIKYLKGIQASPGDRFKVMQLIEARVPLLRLVFDGWLQVDLSMGRAMEGAADGAEEDGEGVDRTLVAVLAAAAHAQAAAAAVRFVGLVKAFAKSWCVVDAHAGLPSSTSWCCLAICFLQMQGCLLSLYELFEAENGADGPAGKRRPRRQLWPVELTPELFVRFFAFVEQVGSRPHKVSLLRGSCRGRYWLSAGKSGGPPHPLFVEFPSARRLHYNIAQSLTPEGWQKAVGVCREARQLLLPKAGRPEADACGALRRVFEGSAGDRAAAGRKRPAEHCGDRGGPAARPRLQP